MSDESLQRLERAWRATPGEAAARAWLLGATRAGEHALVRAAAALVELEPPVSIASIDVYRDGGTVAFTLVGGCGRREAWCLDGRVREPSRGPEPASEPDLFYRGQHPTLAGALPVTHRSALEGALVALLEAAVGDVLTRGEQDHLLASVERRGFEAFASLRQLDLWQMIQVIRRLRGERRGSCDA